MKLFSFVCIFISLLFLTILSTNAFDFTDILGDSIPKIRYCQWDECGIQIGIDAVEWGLDGLETDRSASEYIQSIIVYLLSFISLIAVIYIIYAGFQILIGRGEEEKLKTQKQTIIYVIIGIVVIWLAWPITNFIFDVLNA
jgi:type IV secretory pathway VirB2 component (pilin)